MESKDKKYLKLVEGLKSSNIASNMTSLNVSSEQIELSISHLGDDSDSAVLKENFKNSIEVIRKTKENDIDANTLINLYIKFGDIFQSMLSELLKKKDIECINTIGIQYLNIAKQTKDARIKNIALSIAKAIGQEKEKTKSGSNK